VGGVALDRAEVVEDLVQLGVLPARRVDPGVGGAAVVAVLWAGPGVAVDLAEAADPDRGIHPDRVLAVGAVEALGDQLRPHQAEAVVAGRGEVTRATSSWQSWSVTKRKRRPPPVWPALVHTAWSASAIHSRSEVTTLS
jgi:hypothetical protein